MSVTPCFYGRRQAAALATMNVRAVITRTDLLYVARPIEPLRLAPPASSVGPRFQPRDELGRFVSFASLRRAIAFEYELAVSEMEHRARRRRIDLNQFWT